jgi:fructose-bisphosphate aldolase class II
MPVADYRTYCRMLDRAREDRFAYPAINVSSLTTANAVLKGLAEASLAERVKAAVTALRGTGTSLFDVQ